MEENKGKRRSHSSAWSFVDDFKGDKIIFMIVLILIMISILAISSSTPLLAIQTRSTRSAIIREQVIIAILGLGLLFVTYQVSPKILRFISKYGFVLSLGMLLCLFVRIKLPFMKAVEINGAVRALSIGGFQLHVFEFVKILMVMYLAWAVSAYKNDSFKLANSLSQIDRLSFMEGDFAKKCMYIYGPIILVAVLIMDGSVSSMLFIGLVMGVTVLVGGIKIREIIPVLLFAVLVIGLCGGVYFASGKTKFQRIGTAISRVVMFSQDDEEVLASTRPGTVEFAETLDKVRQPLGAKVAVMEGRHPKGPGGSTQKYIVPVMFEDYMFSFIVEEYGVLGAIFILILYGSLLARGSRIVRYCDNIYAKTLVAGLVLLIAGQALMHMLINVGLAPMTGQTLPLISHGKSSFLAFAIAFGIILGISKQAEKKLQADIVPLTIGATEEDTEE